MDATSAASIIVAIIAAAAAIASQRSAAKAAKVNSETQLATVKMTNEAEAAKGGYERARKFDVETIERQDAEILELRKEVENLRKENRALSLRVWYLESGHKPLVLANEDDDVIDVESEET